MFFNILRHLADHDRQLIIAAIEGSRGKRIQGQSSISPICDRLAVSGGEPVQQPVFRSIEPAPGEARFLPW
jgi:hypothetical protein